MKYEIEYKQCEHTGEWGLIPVNAPEYWIVSKYAQLLAHDILEHNINNLLDNSVLDEFKALGVVYNNRSLCIEYDIVSLFEYIFDDGYVSEEYLEYHYKNEYYEWFMDIYEKYFIEKDLYNDSSYSDLSAKEILDRIIKCVAYYFKQGIIYSYNACTAFTELENLINNFLQSGYVELGCTIQVIKYSNIVRLSSNYNE